MAIGVSLSAVTASDGTFSVDGATAWLTVKDRTATITGTLDTAQMTDAAVTLAKMANLAQDQFIGRTTASTGVPQTATITAAARTVLDDTTVGAMVDTLGGASASGTGGLVRITSASLVTPALGVASATSMTIAALAAASGLFRVITASDTGLLSSLSTFYYAPNSTLGTAGGGTITGNKLVMTDIGVYSEHTNVHPGGGAGTMPLWYILENQFPAVDMNFPGGATPTDGGAMLKLRGRVTSANTHKATGTGGIDSYHTADSGGSGEVFALQGISAWGENNAAITVTFINGGYFVASQTNAGGTATLMSACVATHLDATGGGAGTLAGTITRMSGFKYSACDISGATVAFRAAIEIEAQTGTATADYAIYSASVKTSLLSGGLVLGNPSVATGSLLLARSAHAFLTTVTSSASTGASWTMTLPTGVPVIDNLALVSTTAGVTSWALVPRVVASARITAQSSNATVTSFTVGAADGLFEVSAMMFVSAATALATTLTCTYTDEAGNARSMIFPIQQVSGTFVAAGAITGTGVWHTPVMMLRADAGSTISIITSAGTFTSVTYTSQGAIKQLA